MQSFIKKCIFSVAVVSNVSLVNEIGGVSLRGWRCASKPNHRNYDVACEAVHAGGFHGAGSGHGDTEDKVVMERIKELAEMGCKSITTFVRELKLLKPDIGRHRVNHLMNAEFIKRDGGDSQECISQLAKEKLPVNEAARKTASSSVGAGQVAEAVVNPEKAKAAVQSAGSAQTADASAAQKPASAATRWEEVLKEPTAEPIKGKQYQVNLDGVKSKVRVFDVDATSFRFQVSEGHLTGGPPVPKEKWESIVLGTYELEKV